MTTIFLTAYILMWPAIVAVVLYVIAYGFFKDWKQARKEGISLV